MYRKAAIITLPKLAAAVRAASGRRGVAKAHEALALVRVGVDSPMETRLRLALVADGAGRAASSCAAAGPDTTKRRPPELAGGRRL
jgi:hypothetical protein